MSETLERSAQAKAFDPRQPTRKAGRSSKDADPRTTRRIWWVCIAAIRKPGGAWRRRHGKGRPTTVTRWPACPNASVSKSACALVPSDPELIREA